MTKTCKGKRRYLTQIDAQIALLGKTNAVVVACGYCRGWHIKAAK